jgi:hypothetical protein
MTVQGLVGQSRRRCRVNLGCRFTKETAGEIFDRLLGWLLDAMKVNGWPVTFSIGAVTFNNPSYRPMQGCKKEELTGTYYLQLRRQVHQNI